MHKTSLPAHCARAAALAVAIAGVSLSANAQYAQTNLVSNIPGLATITDPLLVNPWGVSRSETSLFSVSNQVPNSSTLYRVARSTDVTRVTSRPTDSSQSRPRRAARRAPPDRSTTG